MRFDRPAERFQRCNQAGESENGEPNGIGKVTRPGRHRRVGQGASDVCRRLSRANRIDAETFASAHDDFPCIPAVHIAMRIECIAMAYRLLLRLRPQTSDPGNSVQVPIVFMRIKRKS